MTEFTALEIKTPEIYKLIQAINPEFTPPYAEAFNTFYVFGYPTPGQTTWVLPSQMPDFFDHIENGPQLTLKRFIK